MKRPWLRGVSETDAGYVAIMTAILMPVLIMLCAFCVDVARWYVLAEQEQKAADAAGLAGVPFIPQDFDGARDTALRIAAANGFSTTDPNVVIQICSSAESYTNQGAVAASCSSGLRTSQLRVNVSKTIPNFFASIFGFNKQTIGRNTVADFTGPAPIGSPCNVLGNEPPGGLQTTPAGSALPSNSAPANCTTNPQYWGNIHGPDVAKVQGDQYMTRICTASESGCTGSDNDEFSKLGYFLVVRVTPDAVGKSVNLQLYDPAYVNTGGQCGSAPKTGNGDGSLSNPMNDYTSDGQSRYAKTNNAFCTGDQDYGDDADEVPTDTAFGLRHPVDSQVPAEGTPIAGCAQQFYGFGKPQAKQLQQYKTPGDKASGTNPSYRPDLARVFHQWVPFCTFTPDVPGDYYLQVRTNVTCQAKNPDGTCSNPTRVFTQSGDDPAARGNGANRYAVRAVTNDATSVSVSGYGKMGVYANAPATNATFNLIRVVPAAAGKAVVFRFFDPGDGEQSDKGRITVEPPSDATVLSGTQPVMWSTPSGCEGLDRAKGNTSTSCVVTGIGQGASPTWQGKVGTVIVPVPSTYSCDSTNPYGCWFKVNMSFPNSPSGVTDATTWTAYITGDPVRITK